MIEAVGHWLAPCLIQASVFRLGTLNLDLFLHRKLTYLIEAYRSTSQNSRNSLSMKICFLTNKDRIQTKMSASSESLAAHLAYAPVPLKFGTSGRRGEVIHLTQLEIYTNVTRIVSLWCSRRVIRRQRADDS